MKNNTNLIIAKSDLLKIATLLPTASLLVQEFLQGELDRATAVADDQIPGMTVAMNSLVSYLDLDENQEKKVQLVYPMEANISEGRISVLAPLGAALIGLPVGQSITWPLPNGRQKQLKVLGVEQKAS